jgi:hypothetical protein
MQISSFTAVFPALIGKALAGLPRCFQRNRGSLGPRAVFLTLMTMSVLGHRCYSRALHELRQVLGRELGWLEKEPGRSAFSQARKKLSPEECRASFAAVRATLSRARALPRCSFHGLRVHAVDGTRLSLPVSAELKRVFGCPRNQELAPCPQAGLVVLWDVGANQPVAWEVGRYDLGERDAGMRLLSHLGQGDLVLGDRGYPGMEFFHAVRARGAEYLIRMNTTAVAKSAEFVDFLAPSEPERIVSLSPVRNAYRRFPGDQPLTVRFVRDPAHPERVLATSLLDPAITATECWDMYSKRWNIETAFREGKQWHGLEDFHTRFADGIHQEIAAIMTFIYLTGELEVEMRRKIQERVSHGSEPAESATTFPYRFNRLLMADITKTLLCLAIKDPQAIEREWQYSLATLWANRERIRPGRSYPRLCKSPRGLKRRKKTQKRSKKNDGD